MSTSGGGCGSLDKATKAYMFEYQEPATLNQAAPAQNDWYTILDATVNVRVYHVCVSVADTNESLGVQILIDGETIDPVSTACTAGSNYYAYMSPWAPTLLDRVGLNATAAYSAYRAFLCEGHSVQIQVHKTTVAGAGTITGLVQYGVLMEI